VAVQQPLEDVDIPVVEDVPVVENAPVVGHGTVVAVVEVVDDGLGTVMTGPTGGGLRPPAPSSVDPNGIPTRPTADRTPALGDEADAAGLDDAVLLVAQVPDAVPAMPPPSNTALDADVPIPVPDDIPVVDVPLTADVGIPPMPEHVVVVVVGPGGEAPDVVGLTPGVASSVAPSGNPVPATGAPGPIPSGEVMPSGEVVVVSVPTWANAALQPTRAHAVVTINKRLIEVFPLIGLAD
jgi:hypothetical protein